MNEVFFEGANAEGINFSKCEINKSSFADGILAYCNLNDARITETDFFSADLSEASSNYGTKLVDCINVETTIGTPYNF